MTARILRIELRRSTAPWIAVLVVVLGAAMYYLLAESRHGWWIELALAVRIMLALLWPLALGAGAWQARRERRERMEELISSTPRPRWRRVVPTAMAMAGGAVAGYLGLVAAGSGYTLPYATYFPAGTVPTVAVGALSMVAAVWLGMAIGSRLPSVLTPPLLVIAALAVLLGSLNLQGRQPSGVALFLPMLSGGGFDLQMEFGLPTARAHLAQGVWLVAVAATGFLLLAVVSRRGRLVAIVPVVLGAVIAVPLQPGTMTAAFEPDQEAIAQVCAPDTPPVCVPRAHEAILDDLRGPARQALETLSANLPNAPTSVVEGYRAGGGSDPQVLLMEPFPVSAGGFIESPEVILQRLFDGAGTRECANLDFGTVEERDRYLAARQVAAAWLIGYVPPRPPEWDPLSPDTEPALRTLQSLPAGEQRARVAAFREAELACGPGDRMDLLVGPGGPR
jgi:hypothetical protein